MSSSTSRIAGPILLLSLGLTVAPAAASTAPDFESEVLPVLRSRCFACHGPLRQRGNLRLDSRPAMLIGGGRGAAIVPGDAETSLLVSAIRREDELEMPPPRPLDDTERELLEAWIVAGAEWPLTHREETRRRRCRLSAREVPPVEHKIAWSRRGAVVQPRRATDPLGSLLPMPRA